MNQLAALQLSKLPIWAATHINDLRRELTEQSQLNKRLVDAQQESPIFVEDWIGTSTVKRYIQLQNNTVKACWAGLKVEMFLTRQDDPQRPYGVEIRYENLPTAPALRGVAIVPRGLGLINLVAKGHLS